MSLRHSENMDLNHSFDFFETLAMMKAPTLNSGIYFKELENREDRFLNMLVENVLIEIARVL